MKELLYVIIISWICVFNGNTQNIFQQIKASYQMLDSITYIKKACLKECCKFDSDDDIIWCYNKWKNDKIPKTEVVFTLNIDIDSTSIYTEDYIKLDTNEYNFSLIFFDEQWQIKYHISFANNKIYPFLNEFIGDRYVKKFVSGYKKVIKINPKYILRSFRLPYTILYIQNDMDEKIYLYQIWEEKTYELDEYMKIIMDKNNKDNYRYRYLNGVIEW
ncbi:hypothetical protein D0T53_10285 [Dysgonomonas sp. 216]|uniref:hypothetical protein n=1 Tax=Dysgonomonas sp. 216 TaxID=2302934 RepID=UPI0013D3D63F|nr:hypothetical protein [Dysgonomonas sp. 216]NDW19299.1 hypothetical protein [Dysgonomonas sp. 216]